MNPLEKGSFKQIRGNLLSKADGNVIEIGSGTGVNFPFYQNAEKVSAIEPNPYMIQQSTKNKHLASVPIEIIQASAEQLPFEDHSFDTVVATLVFCTIPNPEHALAEMKRVCKPNGKILLFEHVKMDNPILANMQHVFTPFWKKICGGCCLNRDTVHLIKSSELQIIEIKKIYRGLFVVMEIVNHK